MIGSNIYITNKYYYKNYISSLIKQFKTRVAADGGTFEAEQCLKNTLNTLGIVVPPTVVTAPVISGSTAIGSVISTTNGVFDGVTPITYTYQWLLDGYPILGATSSTYTTENLGTLTCKVTATNDFGSANSTSNSLEVEYDTDYQAVLDYGTSLGYTLPSLSQRIKQSNLLTNLKTAGVWSKLDTFANFATDGSSNFALIDWKRLSLYTAVNSPTFTTNKGFTGNGTSSYINTNYNPSLNGVNYTQNIAGISAYQFSISGSARYIIGALNANAGEARIRATINSEYQINGGTVSNASGINSNVIGNLHMDRINSTQIVMQVNETLGNIATDTSTGVPQNPFWINRIISIYNNSGVSNFCARSGFTKLEKDTYNGIYNNYISSL